MKPDGRRERRYAGMTLDEAGELLRKVTRDFEWALSREEYLRKRYPNNFIAVRNKRVVANSLNREDLVAELERKSVDPRTVYINYIPEKRMKYLLHC